MTLRHLRYFKFTWRSFYYYNHIFLLLIFKIHYLSLKSEMLKFLQISYFYLKRISVLRKFQLFFFARFILSSQVYFPLTLKLCLLRHLFLFLRTSFQYFKMFFLALYHKLVRLPLLFYNVQMLLIYTFPNLKYIK